MSVIMNSLEVFKPNLAFISSSIEAKELIAVGKNNSSLILIVTALENFLKDRLIEIIDTKNYSIDKNKKKKKEVNRYSFENFSSIHEAYKLIDFDLKKMIMERRNEVEYFDFLNRICSIRHIFVHKGGIIDSKGVKDLKLDTKDIGKVIEVDKEFAEKAYEAIQTLAVMIDDEFNFRFSVIEVIVATNKTYSKKEIFEYLTKEPYKELEFKGADVNVLKPKSAICSRCGAENIESSMCNKCGSTLHCEWC